MGFLKLNCLAGGRVIGIRQSFVEGERSQEPGEGMARRIKHGWVLLLCVGGEP